MFYRQFDKIKHLSLFFCMLLAVLFFTGCGSEPEDEPPAKGSAEPLESTVFTDNKNGTVSFSYYNNNKEKCKVVTQIEGGKMYQYDIPS